MEKITIYKSDLNHLKQIDCIGAEAYLYIDNNTIYKIYRDDMPKTRVLSIEEKLEALLQNSKVMSIPNINFPEKTIYIDHSFAGITQPYLNGYRNIKDMEYHYKHAIPIFKALSKTLKELHSHNAYFGDLNDKNIMYKEGDVKLIDVDGIRYDKHNCYSYSTILHRYNIEGPSQASDTFALAHLTLDLLTNHNVKCYSYSKLHEKVMDLNLPKELAFFENILLDFEELYVGDYIDTLKEFKYNKEQNTFIRKKTI